MIRSVVRNYLFIAFVLACGLLSVSPVSASDEVIILCFHTFLGTHTSSLDFSEDELAADLDKLASLGYKFVPLEDALEGKIQGNNNIAVTIDDGNHSIYGAYKNIFRPRGIKPVLFIYPAIIDRQKYALTWAQVKELYEDGCPIGAHGFYHLYLTDSAFKKDGNASLNEIEKPAGIFENHIGLTPQLFGYPFGVGSAQAETAIKNAGYDWAFLSDAKVNFVRCDDASTNRYAVPRTIVYRWNFPLIVNALKKKMNDPEKQIAQEP